MSLIQVSTSATDGAAFVPFAGNRAGNGSITNDTGVSLDLRLSTTGAITVIASGIRFPFNLVWSTAEVEVRRTDQVATAVTVELEFSMGSLPKSEAILSAASADATAKVKALESTISPTIRAGQKGTAIATFSSFGQILRLEDFATSTSQGGQSIGFQFTLANDSPLVVTHLGREIITDGHDYPVRLFDESVSTSVPIASGTILNSTPKDGQGCRWVKLGAPVTLLYGHTYRICCTEYDGYKCRGNLSQTAAYVSKLLTGLRGCWGSASGAGYPSNLQAAGTINSMPAMKFNVAVPVIGSPRETYQHTGTAETEESYSRFLRRPAGICWTMSDSLTDFWQVRTLDETEFNWPVKTRLGPWGEITTNAWICISGTADMHPINTDASMLSILPDVENGIQLAGGETGITSAIDLLSRTGTTYYWRLLFDGSMRWGAGAKSAHDVGLSRKSAGILAVGTGAAGDNGGTLEAAAVILKSPNGTRFRVTVTDAGVLSVAAA